MVDTLCFSQLSGFSFLLLFYVFFFFWVKTRQILYLWARVTLHLLLPLQRLCQRPYELCSENGGSGGSKDIVCSLFFFFVQTQSRSESIRLAATSTEVIWHVSLSNTKENISEFFFSFLAIWIHLKQFSTSTKKRKNKSSKMFEDYYQVLLLNRFILVNHHLFGCLQKSSKSSCNF